MASLTVNNLSKSFGHVKALNDVNLSVNDGEFMVMLGPTAAGKTTTLRCLAGLEKLDNGTVTMDNQIVNGLTPAERDVAFVFQSYALYPRKTAFENMAFPLEARKWTQDQISSRVEEIAGKLQITELLNRRPADMSGGQQQRVALGRAMVREPQVFLMDEPLTNLDFKLRVEMRAELKRLQKELDTTFFYVTNDQVEAMSMADRIAVLNEGELQQIDTPENIYDHPANLFVAQFVGSPRMNTLNCRFDSATNTVQGTDSAWHVRLGRSQLDKMHSVQNIQSLIFGVRAEDIQVVNGEDTENTLDGEIFILEPLGDRTYIDVKLGADTFKVRVAPDFDGREGQPIRVRLDVTRCHLFDQDTGMTIF